jgi:hypothetical protein
MGPGEYFAAGVMVGIVVGLSGFLLASFWAGGDREKRANTAGVTSPPSYPAGEVTGVSFPAPFARPRDP